MKNAFQKLIKISKKQKILAGIFGVAIFGGLFFAVEPAYAQLTAISNGLIWFATWMFLQLAGWCMSMTVFFLKLFMGLAEYNNFINAPPVVIGWLMVRDVANMFFVIALLIIAFSTILGVSNYEWKKAMVNLILAAIFINFSKLILQLFIDVAHVFTITFLNAIVGTSGGNLINMFKMEKIMQMTSSGLSSADAGNQFKDELFVGGLMALVMASMAMVTIGAYLVVMLARMIVLWVLIILSPLAFIAQALPKGQTYASQFWDKFTKHVLAAPVMVFFLWLAFATLGSGDIVNDANIKVSDAAGLAESAAAQLNLSTTQSVSILEASTWENLASFLIAIGFLAVGITVVQGLGVQGGGLVGGALTFGKRVATIASGYAAGRWLVGGAGRLAGKGIAGAVYHAPLLGGKKWEQRAKIFTGGIKGWYYGKGIEVTEEGKGTRDQITKEYGKLADAKTPEERQEITKNIEGLEKKLEGQMGGGFFGGLARRGIGLEKRLSKVEKQADVRQQILKKRTGTKAGGYFVGMGTKGIDGFMGDQYAGKDAQDRIERGWLKGEEMRADAKTREFEAKGKLEVLELPRLKFNADKGTFKYEFKAGTMAERVFSHDLGGEYYEAVQRKLRDQKENQVVYNFRDSSDKISELEKSLENESLSKEDRSSIKQQIKEIKKSTWTTPTNISYGDFIENQSESNIRNLATAKARDQLGQDMSSDLFREGRQAKFEADKLEVEARNRHSSVGSQKYEEIDKIEGKIKDLRSNLEEINNSLKGDIPEEERKNILNEKEFFKDQIKKEKEKINNLRKEAEEADNKDTSVVADKNKLRSDAEKIKRDSVGYQYAVQAAKEQETARRFSFANNSLLSDVEQSLVWDARGVDTPTSALADNIERYEKDLQEMDYDTYVEGVRNMLKEYQRRRSSGEEISDSDKEAMAGLFKRGFGESWVDDVIISIMDDEDLRWDIGSELDWSDMEYTPEKIRDIQMLIASGGDVKFAKQHRLAGLMMDAGSSEEIKAANNGKEMGAQAIFDALKSKDRTFGGNIDLQKAFTKIFEDYDKKFGKNIGDTIKEFENFEIEKYTNVLKDNQAQMQMLGNLRGAAIGNNHAENAGYFQKKTVDGESMYVGVGTQQARDHVYSDLNKLDVRKRAPQHTHTVANIDESTGMITMVRSNDYGLVRNGINDTRNYGGTNGRFINQMSGGGATEDTSLYLNTDGRYVVGVRNDGQESAGSKTFSKKYSKKYEGLSDQDRKKITADYIISNIYAPQMAKNQEDFLMTMASASGISPHDAMMEGKMNLQLPDGTEIDNISDLRKMINNNPEKYLKPAGLKEIPPYQKRKEVPNSGANK